MKVSRFVENRKKTLEGNYLGIELEYCLKDMHYNLNHWLKYAGKLSNVWRWDGDGSLGEGGVEFVTKRPAKLSTVFDHLRDLEKFFEENNFKIVDTVRAGVHVHINVADLSLKELFNFMTLYLILEGPLVNWCGNDRVGNLFCLRATDAYAIMPDLIRAARLGDLRHFRDDDLRYSSMNVCSIPKYGSLEFRAMKSTTDFSAIRRWTRFLIRVKNQALEYRTPREIVEEFSALGYEGFLDKIFKEGSKTLQSDNTEDMMMDGMLAAQDLAYSVDDWETRFDKKSRNPFKDPNYYGNDAGARFGDEVRPVGHAGIANAEEGVVEFDNPGPLRAQQEVHIEPEQRGQDHWDWMERRLEEIRQRRRRQGVRLDILQVDDEDEHEGDEDNNLAG